MKIYKADLHIHTCLSPCGDLKMSPKKIIEQVLIKEIDIIAICDHNTAKNVSAVINAAKDRNIFVIPGIEICTIEEVHLLALFENLQKAKSMEEIVYSNLIGKNNPDLFGVQVIANEDDEVEGFEEKLLIGSINLNIDKVIDLIHKFDGLAIASHIDKQNYSIISQLGFIPDHIKFDALEVSTNLSLNEFLKFEERFKQFPILTNSDAHFLEDIGRAVNKFQIDAPNFEEIKMALKNLNGRRLINF